MKSIKKAVPALLLVILLSLTLTANGKKQDKKKELTILAAASLTDVCAELKAGFEKDNPDIKLTFSFGGSGALKIQIEEGAPADVFLSAAQKQMNDLNEKGLIEESSVKDILENKIVLVTGKGRASDYPDFNSVTADSVGMIALGDPESVPAGQYAEEVFTTLGILENVKKKANYGSNVRTVLSWVESGNADCGVVYATDAFTSNKVEIAAYAPEGSCKKVVYPAGIVKASKNQEEAKKFLAFLESTEAGKLFEKYGFTVLKS